MLRIDKFLKNNVSKFKCKIQGCQLIYHGWDIHNKLIIFTFDYDNNQGTGEYNFYTCNIKTPFLKEEWMIFLNNIQNINYDDSRRIY